MGKTPSWAKELRILKFMPFTVVETIPQIRERGFKDLNHK